MYKVIVNGAQGKMGSTTCQAISNSGNYELVAGLDREDSLDTAINSHDVDIVIDFTNALSVYDNAKAILNNKVKCVIGASGLSQGQVDELAELAKSKQTGCIIAPNFSIGAILMMHFAKVAARFLPEVEIIETHHQQKLDAPSGTAVKTAQLIEKARSYAKNTIHCEELYAGARGAEVHDVTIHSLRLPGYIASQQVMFGSEGENLTLLHNSISRECFMPGVLLACDEVLRLDSLVYGLENLLNL